MDYRMVLSNLKIAGVQFLVTVEKDVSCHVTLGDFQRWLSGKKFSLTYQCLIFSEKTKVTQFARLCRIITCLHLAVKMAVRFQVKESLPQGEDDSGTNATIFKTNYWDEEGLAAQLQSIK